VYAIFAKIDEVILAPGELQPLGADRPIKAPFAGVVKEILVKEGQQVWMGQALVRLDPDVSGKRAQTLKQQLRLERTRFNEESRSIEARAQSLRERMDGLIRSLRTERQIYGQIRPLAEQGGIQMMQVLQQRNRVQQLRSEMAQAEANLREVQAELVRQRQESLRNLADLTGSGWRSKRPRTRNCCGRRLMGWCLTWFPPAAVMRRVRTRRCSSWCPAAAWKPRCFSPIAKWDL